MINYGTSVNAVKGCANIYFFLMYEKSLIQLHTVCLVEKLLTKQRLKKDARCLDLPVVHDIVINGCFSKTRK